MAISIRISTHVKQTLNKEYSPDDLPLGVNNHNMVCKMAIFKLCMWKYLANSKQYGQSYY